MTSRRAEPVAWQTLHIETQPAGETLGWKERVTTALRSVPRDQRRFLCNAYPVTGLTIRVSSLFNLFQKEK